MRARRRGQRTHRPKERLRRRPRSSLSRCKWERNWAIWWSRETILSWKNKRSVFLSRDPFWSPPKTTNSRAESTQARCHFIKCTTISSSRSSRSRLTRRSRRTYKRSWESHFLYLAVAREGHRWTRTEKREKALKKTKIWAWRCQSMTAKMTCSTHRTSASAKWTSKIFDHPQQCANPFAPPLTND